MSSELRDVPMRRDTLQLDAMADLINTNAQVEQDPVLWKDPTNDETYLIDSRTGNSLQSYQASTSSTSDSTGAPRSSRYVDRRWLKGMATTTADHSAPALPSLGWIRPVFEVGLPQLNGTLHWERQVTIPQSAQLDVYKAPEKPIRTTVPRVWADLCPHTHASDTALRLGTRAIETKRRFAREDLRTAHIIGQVDRKFIACVIESADGTRTLVLIDQHAADERVRVERFLGQLASEFMGRVSRIPGTGVRRVALPHPTPVLLTSNEVRACASLALRGFMSQWGFDVTLDAAPPHSDDDTGQVYVLSVPELVSSRVSQSMGGSRVEYNYLIS